MKVGIIVKKLLIVVSAIVLMGAMPASVYALSEEQLDKFAQNDIMFYDPNGGNEKCSGTNNGIFKGKQYSLTDDELRGLARAAENENGCSVEAIKTELSLLANLYEKKGSSYSSIIDYLKNGGWFADGTVAAYNNTSASVSDEYLQAARDVLVNGNRTIPAQVIEHDCLGDFDWVEVDGVRYNANNAGDCKGTGISRNLFKSGKTKVHNVYGATYIFYQWAGGKDTGCGDPFGYMEDNPPTGSYSVAGGRNINYAGAKVWSDAELQAVEVNRPFYEEAANKYGFPWQILAVIHKREHNLIRNNPENGQGAYQLYSYVQSNGSFTPAGTISDEEFARQTDIAAQVIVSKAGGADLSNLSDASLKRLFFNYNGAGSAYIDQAIKMGFSEAEAKNGEGSPYVMNRYDLRRDPTVSPTSTNGTWGQIKTDGGEIEYPANSDFGAFVLYEALAGTSETCNGLISGGMTLAQAQEFMQYYKEKAGEYRNYKQNVELDGVTLYHYDSCGSALTNCVAFSRWFVSKYTDLEKGRIPAPNGGKYVSELVNAGFVDGGHTPRPYAVFSFSRRFGANANGHTGVVLGVDESRGKIIIGEANCSGSGVADVDFIGAKEADLSAYMKDEYTYAYTDSHLTGF